MKIKTPAVKKSPRKNLNKDEVKAQIAQSKKINHIKDVVRRVFPLIANVESIYDGQTVVNALSGFISAHLEVKTNEIKISELPIDLSSEKVGEIKKSILAIIDELKDEPAKGIAQTLERLGKALADFGTNKFMKQPMKDIAITDILA